MQNTVAKSQTNSTLVFIDSRVKDYQILAHGVTPNAEIIVLKPTEDAIEQITGALQVRNNVASIHIISHGSPGCLYLGNTQFSLETLERYAKDLQTWSTTLASSDRCNSPSIVLYGCNVAAEDQGVEFVERLSQITGVAVAASTTLTGNAALGGNWNFEMNTGAIASASVFQQSALAAYPHVLALAFPNILYGVNGTDLRAIDLSNGTSTSVGTLTFTSAAIARESNTGRIYYTEQLANGRVAYFDPFTGTNTTLPQTTGVNVPSFARLSQATSGVIYAMSGTSLYTLDQNTGAATLVGSVSGLGAGGGDMAFDPLNPNRLLIYVSGVNQTQTQTLYSVDVTSPSLQATAIGGTGLTAGGAALAFGQDGQLYLAAVAPNPTTNNLYRLDLTTAAATLIGPTTVGYSDFASLPVPTADVDLQVTATDGLTSVTPNSQITYTVTVTNSSTSSDLQGIGVSDLVPAAISGVTWNAVINGTGSFPTAGDQSGSGNTIDVNVNLNAGASVTYTITGRVSSSTPDGSIISNTATVTPPDGINDPNSANNSSTDTTTFDGFPIVTVNSLITNDSRPALSGTINDPTAAVVVNINGTTYTTTNSNGIWTLADNAIATPLADGTYNIVATATDPAGNIATDASTNELTIDTAPPIVTVNPLITNDSQPALSGTVNDSTAAVVVNVNGTNYTTTNSNGTWTLADNAIATPLADGTYNIVATATDPAGNIATDASTNELTIDTAPPIVTVNPLITNDSQPALSGTINDPAAAVVVNVNGTTYATTNSNGIWTLADNAIATPLADGTYNIVATATDPAGNVATDASTNELTIDTAPPIVTVNPLITNDSQPALSGTINDPAAAVVVNVNGTTYATTNSNGTWTLANDAIAPALADGTYNIVATATDPAGNVATDTTASELTIDTAVPIVTVNPLITNDSQPALSGTINDPTATVVVNVNGTNYTTTNSNGTWTLANDAIAPALVDGTYEVLATATDPAGNVATDATASELTIDTAVPTVTVNPLITNDSQPALTGTINDPTATVVVNVNGTNYTTTNSNGTWTLANDAIAPALADGTYNIVATATDPAGNVATDATVSELTIDTAVPTVGINPLATNDSSPTLTGTVNEPTANVVLTINGTDYTTTNNGDGTWTLADNAIAPNLADGTYDIVATATDPAGNVGIDLTSNELTVDTAPPTVGITQLSTNDSSPILTGTVNDPNANVVLTVNNTNYNATNNGDGTWTLADNTIAPPLADGTYDVTVTATDTVGNIGTDTSTNELIIDTTPSAVTVNVLITNDSRPALSGTVNDPVSTVVVNVNGIDYIATNSNGTWTLADDAIATALADGTYDVVATATDPVGNTRTDNSTNELTIDTVLPAVTVDALNTSDSQPPLTGTVDDPNATVVVNVSGTDYTAINNGDGTWTLANDAITTPLADDTYDVVATATDLAGNAGTDATNNELIVDTTAPTVGVNQLITNDSRPALTGTVNEPIATVIVNVNGTEYAATNNGDGTWTLADDAIATDLADGTYNILATATDPAGNVATDATTSELTIDTVLPTVTVNPLNTNDSRPPLTGAVNDPTATVVVNVNGTDYTTTNNGDGTWTLADDAIATALADGTYDVVATATDPAGNVGTDATTTELTIDTAPPTVTVNPLITNDSQPALTGTVNEPTATVIVNVNGTDYTTTNNGDGTWTLANDAITTPLADGTYDVAVTATDLAGNIGTDATNNELIVDTAASTVGINPLITNDSRPALTGTVNDPTATVIVNVNGTDYTTVNNGDGTWTLADDAIATDLADGTYNILATATDLAGNVAIDATTSELTVDTVLPTVTVNSLNTNDSRPSLTGTVNDPTATVIVNVNGTDYTTINNGDGTWTLADDAIATPLADGTYDVAVTATDPAGNAGNDTTINELLIDTALPTVTINPLDTNDPSPSLTGTVDDLAATVQVTVNGTNYTATNNGNGTWSLANDTITPDLADGTYEVVVTATDPVGNVGTDTSTNELIIDRAPSIVGINPLTTNDSRPALTGTIDDPTATVQVAINGSNYNATNNGDGTWTLADDAIAQDLPDGTYEVVVTATDIAGNVGIDTSTNELTIDLVPPTVGINPLITNNPSPALTGTISDPEATVVVTVNETNYTATNNGDGTWTLADETITPALPDGSYDVVVTGTDLLGNVGTDSSTNELTIDTTAPTVSINPLITNDSAPLLTGTVNDSSATIVVTVNGTDYTAITNEDGTWTLADNTITPALASGTYDVVVTATDSLGNVSTDNTSNELTINATATNQSLSVTANDFFVIQSNAPTATVKFTNVESNAGFVNEMGVFTVDDEQGTINGIAPGEAGYLKAALERGKVIFSALANNEFSNLLSPRELSLETGKSLAFYLVQNNTTDNVLASLATGGPVPNVFFASASINADGFEHLQIRDLGNNAFEIAQEDSSGRADSDFNDLLVRFELSNDPPSLGTNLQGSPQRELIDLTQQQGQTVQASLNLDSSAEFDNLVGFYRLANEDGTVIDPITGQAIAPGSPGYAQAALANSVVQYDQNATEPFLLEGGAIYAPYLLADGDPNAAYFPYLGSNAAGFDHLRLLGNNVFGFEDQVGGGDQDFNDMVLQVNLSVVETR